MNTRIRYLLRQYFDNRASREELEEFFRTVRSAEYDEDLAALIKETYEALRRENPSSTYIDAGGNLTFPKGANMMPATARPPRNGKRLALAVMSTAAALAAALWFWPIAPHGDGPDATQAHVQVVKQAASDENKVIQLNDGTKVWLNSSSKLEYPQAFDASSPREVSLTGEAFFEVAKAADWPFVVHTGPVKTTVLGTAFNIKAYPGMPNISVSVKQGKVAVSKDNQKLATLESNQELRVALEPNAPDPTEELTLNSKVAGKWKEGYLDYEDETIASVIADLERFYGIRVDLADGTLANEEITISLRRDSHPEFALDILCRLLDKQLDKQGNQFIIY